MNMKMTELMEMYVTDSFSSKSSQHIFEGLLAVLSTSGMFRYSSAESAIRNLIEESLFFNSPLNFNDERDCNPKLLHIPDEYLVKKSQEVIRKMYGNNFSDKQIDKILKQSSVRHDVFPAARKLAIDHAIGSVIMTCFTLENTNELMWAHYANKGKGICIEYDTRKLLVFLATLPVKPVFLKVKYEDDIQPVRLEINDVVGSMITWLLTKSAKYSYEDEIRFVFLDKKQVVNPFHIPSYLIRGITLGTKISSEDSSLVLAFASRQNTPIPVYRMELSDKLNLIPKLIL